MGVIITPTLSPKEGYVEVDNSGVRSYSELPIETPTQTLIDRINAVVALQVASGQTITAKDVVTIANNLINPSTDYLTFQNKKNFTTSNPTTMQECIMLSSTSFMVAYINSSNLPTVVVGTVTNNIITYGAEFHLGTGGCASLSIAKFTSTQVLAYFGANTGTGYMVGYVCILTVSGTTVTTGGYNAIGASHTINVKCAVLSSTLFAIAYRESYNDAESAVVICGTISGPSATTIASSGSKYTFSTVAVSHSIDILATLTSTSCLLKYFYYNSAWYSYSRIISFSGTVATFNTIYSFPVAANTSPVSVAIISSTTVLFSFCDYGSTNYGKCLIATISGTALSFGTQYTFKNYQLNSVNCVLISSTKALLSYATVQGSETYIGFSRTISISGNTITFGTEFSFITKTTTLVFGVVLTSTQFIISFGDYNNSKYGSSIVCTLSKYGDAISIDSGTAGSNIRVIFDGVAAIPGITKGTTITSAGVKAFSHADGYLSVKGYWKE